MNVWIVNQFANSPARGTSGTRHHALARRLIALGHRATVICGSYDHITGQRVGDFTGPSMLSDEAGVPFRWIRIEGDRSMLGRIRSVWSFSSRLVSRFNSADAPDVIIGSSPQLLSARAALRLARRLRVPFVLEVRDLWPDSLIELGRFSSRHPAVLLLRIVERQLYRNASHIITLLPQSKERISQTAGAATQITVIPNGIDPSLIPQYTPPPEDDQIRVIYAGAHGIANNLDVVLEAAKIAQSEPSLQKVKFLLVGNGPEKPRLIEKAARESITNLSLLDPVPKARVFDLLKTAEIFLLPLKPAALFQSGVSPNKLFDYMCSGRPTLFAVSCDHNPIRESGGGICVEAGSPQAIVAGLKKLLQLSALERAEMGRKARDYVLAKHNFETLGEDLERVLRTVCPRETAGGKPSRPALSSFTR